MRRIGIGEFSLQRAEKKSLLGLVLLMAVIVIAVLKRDFVLPLLSG